METLSFAFGMLAMTAITLIVTVILGIVKVYKHQSEIRSIQEWVSNLDQQLSSQINEEHKLTNKRIDEVYSYTDSRFDKLQSKLTQQGSKELLKG